MHRSIVSGILALALSASWAVASPGPKLPVERAAALAQQHLKERGLDDRVFVRALLLETTTVARGQKYWYARWSESVVAGDEQKKEVGLRINMDGSLVRVVESPSKKYADHRTRATRPSVLDLKH